MVCGASQIATVIQLRKGSKLLTVDFYEIPIRGIFHHPFFRQSLKRDYIRMSRLHPSAVNVCNRGKGERNVYNFLSLQSQARIGLVCPDHDISDQPV